MSDHIPFEIQEEIMFTIPVKSLIQFRSVSKKWKSVIDSSDFVARYSSQQQHIFVRYGYNAPDYIERFVSIVEDHTFSPTSVSLTPPPRFLVGNREYYDIIGCCHGLLCFYAVCEVGGRAVIWNPSIRRAYDVVVPNVEDILLFNTTLGFGVCHHTNDPKIVKITSVERYIELESISSIPCQVEVFTLSTGAWRSLSSNLPPKSVCFHQQDHITYSVAIGGLIYWLATNRITADGGLIISFDIITEEFGEINLPNRLAQSQHFLTMSKLRDSLVVLEHVEEPDREVYSLWMMEGGLFTELYTFNVDTQDQTHIMGFRWSGEPIIEFIDDDDGGDLVVYKPHSNQIGNLGFDGLSHTFSVQPYMETLLLHDQPNLTCNNR